MKWYFKSFAVILFIAFLKSRKFIWLHWIGPLSAANEKIFTFKWRRCGSYELQFSVETCILLTLEYSCSSFQLQLQLCLTNFTELLPFSPAWGDSFTLIVLIFLWSTWCRGLLGTVDAYMRRLPCPVASGWVSLTEFNISDQHNCCYSLDSWGGAGVFLATAFSSFLLQFMLFLATKFGGLLLKKKYVYFICRIMGFGSC